MAWYKKQLAEKLKIKKDESKKSTHPTFDPRKIKGSKISPNPVAARNINRPKTDKP